MKRDNLQGLKVTVVGGAFLGFIVSLSLLLQRQGLTGCIVGGSDCSFLAGTDLGVVVGVPLPIFLTGYFSALGVAGALLGSVLDPDPDTTLAFILLMVVAAVPVSLWLPLASHVRFGKHCIYCLTLASGNVLTFGLVTWYLWPTIAYRRTLRSVVLGIGCLCAPVALLLALHRTPPPEAAPDEIPTGPVALFATPAVVVEVDPSCRHCASQWPAIEAALAELEESHRLGPVQLQLLPQDDECLRLIGRPSGRSRDGSCRAAAHVYCAMLQGRAVPLLRTLFQTVHAQGGADFMSLLDAAGYDSLEAERNIDADLQHACTGDTGERWSMDIMPAAFRAGFVAHLRASAAIGLQVPALLVNRERIDLHSLDKDRLVRALEAKLHRSSR